MADPYAFPLSNEIRPVLRTLIVHDGFGYIGQLSGSFRQLRFQRGFIDNCGRVQWVNGWPKCDNFTQLWTMSGNVVQQSPLKMYDFIDPSFFRIDGTWSTSGHGDVWILQRLDQPF